MWYILCADEGAGIYCGFKRDTSRGEFLEKVENGTVEELLNFIPVKRGDCFLIEAGTVHAIGAGCVICEVQESSNVTYRVYDYLRKDADGNFRALHVDKAAEIINYRAYSDRTGSGKSVYCGGGAVRLLTECEYFRCRELLLSGEYSERAERSFVALNVLEGKGEVNGIKFRSGDSFFVPCGESFVLKGRAKIMMTDEGRAIKYYAGIDLGGTFIKCGIVSSRGELIVKDKIPTGSQRPYGLIAEDMASLVGRLAKRAGRLRRSASVRPVSLTVKTASSFIATTSHGKTFLWAKNWKSCFKYPFFSPTTQTPPRLAKVMRARERNITASCSLRSVRA